MNAIPKKKLCWNCDGRVDLHLSNCPYCGVYLSPSEDGDEEEEEEVENELAPPYKLASTEAEAAAGVPKSPFSTTEAPAPTLPASDAVLDLPPAPVGFKEMIYTMILLFGGSIFFMFSMFMFLFGQNGTLSLEWDAEYWYAYTLIALPLLYFGWRGLALLNEEHL